MTTQTLTPPLPRPGPARRWLDGWSSVLLLVTGVITAPVAGLLVSLVVTAALLVFAGAFNGILLPVGIGVMLYVGWFRRDLLHGYDYPKWLLVIGSIAWLLTLYLAVTSVRPLIDLMTS